MGIGVGDDAEAGHFGSGTRGGVDRNKGSHGHGALVDALVVTDVSAAGGDQADTFGAVMGRAAAQGDDEVATVIGENLHTIVNVFVGRVRFGARVDNHIKTGVFQVAGDGFGNAHFMEAGIGDDHCFFSAQLLGLGTNFFGTTGAHEGNAGDEEAVSSFCEINNGHVESSSIDEFYVEASRLSLLNKKSARKSFLPNTDKL